MPSKGDNGIDGFDQDDCEDDPSKCSDLTVYTETNPKQGYQMFRYEEYYYSPCSGCENIILNRLRFKSKSGKFDGCVALYRLRRNHLSRRFSRSHIVSHRYGRNGKYSNGGSPIAMQDCQADVHMGGQRQDIQIPGNGRSNGAKGTLKFDKQPGFCIGGTEGSPKDGKLVYSDQCRTGYKVKLVGDAPPGPPPNCGRKCSSDSDCQTGGFVQYPTCYVNSGTMCHGYCGP